VSNRFIFNGIIIDRLDSQKPLNTFIFYNIVSDATRCVIFPSSTRADSTRLNASL